MPRSLSTRLGLESLEGREVPATLYGITSTDALIRFDSATPGTVTTIGTVSGLAAGQTVVDIAFRPSTGELYGIGFNPNMGAGTGIGELYTLNVNTRRYGCWHGWSVLHNPQLDHLWWLVRSWV